MNNHDSFCPQSEGFDKDSDLWMRGPHKDLSCRCKAIAYIRESMKPGCTCGHEGYDYYFHLVPCKQGAFLMSQDKTEWKDLDEI
jgi:hypothetical protein